MSLCRPKAFSPTPLHLHHPRRLFSSVVPARRMPSTSVKVGLAALATTATVYTFYAAASYRKQQNLLLQQQNSATDEQQNATTEKEDNERAERRTNAAIDRDRKRKMSASAERRAGEEAARNLRDARESSQWDTFSNKLLAIKSSVLSLDLNLLPDWKLPEWITKLQRELNMEPGSLANEIWTEARDPNVNPEVTWDAHVRLGAELCEDEKQFLKRRRAFTRQALARYLEIPEDEVHEDDVPTIAITGSGGGLRAMVAGAGYYQALADAGLFNCVTYMSGVSGSCWLQSIYLSSLGQCDFGKVIEHLKSRINVHIAYPPTALELLSTPPTNKYLLRGFVERLMNKAHTVGLVDVYGVLLAGRLLVPSEDKQVQLNEKDLRLSHQRRYVDSGTQPLPLYSTVRHEFGDLSQEEIKEEMEEAKEEKGTEPWFQWFEATPYEFYSEDMEAGVPIWALGRRFEKGHNLEKTPEIKLPIFLGVLGSAFTATLSHYYHEIRPFVTSVSIFNALDKMVLERNNDLVKLHPINPASVPNYVKGLKDSLPPTCPKSLWESESMQLMDAGMSNNLGCYPLLRQERNVDVLIAFDSSAEIQTANWLKFVEGYAKQRKIQGWPIAIGWPEADNEHMSEQLEQAQAHTADEAEEKLEQAQRDQEAIEQSKPLGQRIDEKRHAETLGPCTVWCGSKEVKATDEEPPPSKAVTEDWELTRPDAGIAVVYMPFIRNDKVPDVDPEVSPYLSTWNFEWTPEQVDKTIQLAQANFRAGEERLKRTVRAVYERKKKLRLEREEKKSVKQEETEQQTYDENDRQHHNDHFS